MHLTLIKPKIGRRQEGPYIDEGRMEPLMQETSERGGLLADRGHGRRHNPGHRPPPRTQILTKPVLSCVTL